MRTSFLFNSSGHADLRSAFEGQLHGTKRLLILVGFVMKSGAEELIRLCRKERVLPSSVTIITGLSFGITEPQALRCLLKKKFTLRLFQNRSKIFHPKIYIFQKKATSSVLVGSANLSGAALTRNIEAAALLTMPSEATELKSLMNFWNAMLKESALASMVSIKDYERTRKLIPYVEPDIKLEPHIKQPKKPKKPSKKRNRRNERTNYRPSPKDSLITKHLRRMRIIKDHPGRLMFKGKMFELTGRFNHGFQKFCEKEILKRGGQVEPFHVTKNTDVLVIGSLGSPNWFMTTYGKKMAKAAKYRQETGSPLIISEEQWEKALS
jgi:HKD family nuclease